MFEHVRKPRLSMRVAATLCSHMVERGLGPDDRLPAERELAAMFAVSRQVVREALRQLEARQLVTVDHGRGTIVLARPTPDDLAAFTEQLGGVRSSSWQETLETRAVFEAGLADLIIMRATDAEIERLATIVEKMRARVRDRLPVGADDVAFHDQLLRCTGNSMLIDTGQRLVLGYLQTSLLQTFDDSLEWPEGIDLFEHEQIVAAIRRRDVDELRRLLRFHCYPFDSSERMEAGLPAPGRRIGARDRNEEGES